MDAVSYCNSLLFDVLRTDPVTRNITSTTLYLLQLDVVSSGIIVHRLLACSVTCLRQVSSGSLAVA